MDKNYTEYNVYNQIIKLIDTLNTVHYIESFEDSNAFYLTEHRVRMPRRIPSLDSSFWKDYNMSNLELTDSITNSLHDLKKTIGISTSYYINGYYLVQYKKIWQKSEFGYCGTGIPNSNSLFYKRIDNKWFFQFAIYD